MRTIFISYRQADSKGWAIGLRDTLAERFGEAEVFLDKDALGAGNWREQIEHALDGCKVVLVVIGSRWLTIVDEHGKPRIREPDDVHRQEIALALKRSHITVIPVRVDGASMPEKDDLPEDLWPLCDQQSRELGDSAARRQVDLDVLFADIERASGLKPLIAGAGDKGLTASEKRSLRPGFRGIALAVASTAAVAVYYQVSGAALTGYEMGFVFLFFIGLVILFNWVRTFLS